MTGRTQSATVEAFSAMQEDIDKECKVIMQQWAKRVAQIARLMGGTVGQGTGRHGAGRTTCSWFQLPERLVFGLKFGSSLMMYSLDPFNQA